MDLFAPQTAGPCLQLAARPGAVAPLTLDEVFSLVSRPVWQAPAADLTSVPCRTCTPRC